MLPNIKVLIWDLDGTIYQSVPELWKDVREGEYRTIMNHTGWSHEKTVEEFVKLHKVVYQSATEVAAVLSGILIAEAAVEMEQYFDRRKYLVRDDRLIDLFNKLKQFRHFTLANGMIARQVETLAVLGLSDDTFEEMVTSETVGVTKPHDAGFRYILKKTNVPAKEHLMIGDRETIDLLPAKKLGMKTCLVWTDLKKQFSHADIVLPTVYDVARLWTKSKNRPSERRRFGSKFRT